MTRLLPESMNESPTHLYLPCTYCLYCSSKTPKSARINKLAFSVQRSALSVSGQKLICSLPVGNPTWWQRFLPYIPENGQLINHIWNPLTPIQLQSNFKSGPTDILKMDIWCFVFCTFCLLFCCQKCKFLIDIYYIY